MLLCVENELAHDDLLGRLVHGRRFEGDYVMDSRNGYGIYNGVNGDYYEARPGFSGNWDNCYVQHIGLRVS